MQMNEAVVALIATISTAFANGPTPPLVMLVYPDTWETRDLIQDLTPTNGTPDRAFIERHLDSLAAFTPEGLRHVLPHYLLYSLENPDSEATERVIIHLSPEEFDTPYWRERLHAFSPVQRRAVCKYLQHMRTELADQRFDTDFLRGLSIWGCE